MQNKEYTLTKAERIYLQNRIDLLFTKGQSFIAYPLRVVYTIRQCSFDEPKVAILTSVSKKRFKRAVKRNRIKRLIKEAYRLNKSSFNKIYSNQDQAIDIAFLYLKNELCEYSEIEKAVLKTVSILSEKLLPANNANESNP